MNNYFSIKKMNLLARNEEIILEIVEIGIMIRWVITVNEFTLYTYLKTGKLQRIAKKSKL